VFSPPDHLDEHDDRLSPTEQALRIALGETPKVFGTESATRPVQIEDREDLWVITKVGRLG
jgi:hypothetical protein